MFWHNSSRVEIENRIPITKSDMKLTRTYLITNFLGDVLADLLVVILILVFAPNPVCRFTYCIFCGATQLIAEIKRIWRLQNLHMRLENFVDLLVFSLGALVHILCAILDISDCLAGLPWLVGVPIVPRSPTGHRHCSQQCQGCWSQSHFCYGLFLAR